MESVERKSCIDMACVEIPSHDEHVANIKSMIEKIDDLLEMLDSDDAEGEESHCSNIKK